MSFSYILGIHVLYAMDWHQLYASFCNYHRRKLISKCCLQNSPFQGPWVNPFFVAPPRTTIHSTYQCMQMVSLAPGQCLGNCRHSFFLTENAAQDFRWQRMNCEECVTEFANEMKKTQVNNDFDFNFQNGFIILEVLVDSWSGNRYWYISFLQQFNNYPWLEIYSYLVNMIAPIVEYFTDKRPCVHLLPCPVKMFVLTLDMYTTIRAFLCFVVVWYWLILPASSRVTLP